MAAVLVKSVRVVEFYSGAGGFHFALLKSGIKADLVASFDINTNANRVYKHNFPDTPHFNRNISGLSPKELDELTPDMFVLSPPCQPFTRQGLQRDDLDRRTDSFFHLFLNLKEMKNPPSYIIVENVKGFEISRTRERFVTVLNGIGYQYQEFLLSPAQFGIPNSRLRYYLVARRCPLQFLFASEERVCCTPGLLLRAVNVKPATPHSQESSAEDMCTSHATQSAVEGVESVPVVSLQASYLSQTSPPCSSYPDSAGTKPLSTYLEALSEEDLQRYLIPLKILSKYGIALDIVTPLSTHSCCFTKAYGNYALGTGSVLYCGEKAELDKAFQTFTESQKCKDLPSDVCSLTPLHLRYFTPKEVANLMCFPSNFGFPSDLSIRQCYKVIGNSLNVHVVSILMKYLVL